MDMDFAKKLLNEHRKRLSESPMFECAVCGQRKYAGASAGVRLWKPTGRITSLSSKGKVATYVVCLECAELTDAVIHHKATEYLAAHGLFDR